LAVGFYYWKKRSYTSVPDPTEKKERLFD